MTNGKVVLDTNAVINALNRGLYLPSADYYVSVITEIELFSYPKLTESDAKIIRNFMRRISIIPLDDAIKDLTIHIRKNYNIKLPDSIVCATALYNDSFLITDDKKLGKIENLNILTLEEYALK